MGDTLKTTGILLGGSPARQIHKGVEGLRLPPGRLLAYAKNGSNRAWGGSKSSS